jgi:transcription initiation factor TFIID TATA-box-binding protein
MIMGDDDGLASFQVQNIVASATLGQPLRLPGIRPTTNKPNSLYTDIYVQLRGVPWIRSISYNPEMFPGMCLRMRERNCVCLLFASGKCVITGAHNEEEIDQIFENVYRAIVTYNDD